MENKEHITRLARQGLLEERIEDLYDQAPCGYFSTLPDGTFIKTNGTFLKWLGYDASQLLFVRRLQDLLPVGDSIFYETHYHPLLLMQGFISEVNLSLRHQAGKTIPVLVNTRLVKDADGRPALLRTTVFDITDRKKYELELLRARKKAEEGARVKAEFLATVSHEIRTPINAIVGIAHLLRDTGLSPRQAELLSVLEVSTETLLRLVNNILDFSKIEAGRVSLQEESTNIRNLVGSVLHGFGAKAAEKGLSIRLKIDERVPEQVYVDSLKLVQVLNNLLSNAVKFTEQGHVAVRVALQEQTPGTVPVVFEVADTGIGIAPDKRGLIFEEFAQASAGIDRAYGGTGLGLAISQRLLGMYGSELKVESEPGTGSSFSFTLSLKISEEAPRAARQAGRAGAARGVRLLLVEDNKINVYVLSQYLANWGVAFDVAGNGQEGVEKAGREAYDLILMDLQMPVMDGYEAARRIRNMREGKRSKVPIIALTASAQPDYEGKLTASGINGVLAKPFNPEELYRLIASYGPVPALPIAGQAAAPHPQRPDAPFDLSTFDDLMADDPEGMRDLISVTVKALRQACAELTKALRERNRQLFTRWVQHTETSLELLQAKQLYATLEQAMALLSTVPVDPEQLELAEHLIGTQFRVILQGLAERLKPGE
ncbi:hypothetical protein GCM10023188_19360 [Pontibacter saemangeumensis]|uniref:histidine kinase n=1 Tax=Pontibacter saemangeumensis TaxID=1084525 RepID=A0ABP8LNU4_9BACT